MKKAKYNKVLRVSSDYVAVDLVDEKLVIVDTPIYLQLNKAQKLFWYDAEKEDYILAVVMYNGKELRCADGDMFTWISPVTELLTEAIKP